MRWKAAGILLTATILSVGLSRTVCYMPPTACRFVRYLRAAQTPEMKASWYEKVVYSLVMATNRG